MVAIAERAMYNVQQSRSRRDLMRTVIPFGIFAAVATAALAQTDARVAESGRMFQQRCVSCHQPPDLRFSTDRAWLDQVNRTA